MELEMVSYSEIFLPLSFDVKKGLVSILSSQKLAISINFFAWAKALDTIKEGTIPIEYQ